MNRSWNSLAFSVASLLLGAEPSPAASPDGGFLFTSAPRYKPWAWTRGGARFPDGSTVWRAERGKVEPLVPSLASSSDPFVSFDGKKVLVSGHVPGSQRRQIWEIILDGGQVRQMTSGDADCVRPLYLPDRRIAYTRLEAGGPSIEVAGDGVSPERITFTPDRLITADILDDGRILFEIARTPGDGIHREIWTVLPDGSGAALLVADQGRSWCEPVRSADGTILFLDRQRWVNSFDPQSENVKRVAGFPGLVFGPPASLTKDRSLVSMQLSGRIHAELYYWDGRSAIRADLRRPAGAWAVQPTALTGRPRPKDYPASLLPNRKEAVVLFHAAATREQRPAAASVRALTWEPSAGVRPLGVLPLQTDGSFYAVVDSDRPLRFQFLDSSGRTIGEQESWIWLRPGEQRTCVGCHASTKLAPSNRVPLALKSGRPSRFREGQGPIGESETLP